MASCDAVLNCPLSFCAIMSDQQCGLCLSCGAPFMPDIEEVDFFNREANLSVLFLNTQFKRNPDIVRTYDVPKLCSQRQASHMIHASYHETALQYMSGRHRHDDDVNGGVVVAAGNVVADVGSAPFLYYHTATGNKGPKAARWTRPTANQRIDMSPLLDLLELDQFNDGWHAVPLPQIGVKYDICAACNALMTQKSHMRYLLGCRNAGRKNPHGNLVPLNSFTQHIMDQNGSTLDDAYGAWSFRNGAHTNAPRRNKSDSDAPCIAYYLHMCLPYEVPGAPHYFNGIRFPHNQKRIRGLFLELCWVILEIACLATLNEEGTATKPGSRKSHGEHQHRGVLDLYVSYFMWRLTIYSRGNRRGNRRQIDFVQFHQKYYGDARNCPGLLNDGDRLVISGKLMYDTTKQNPKTLVEKICANLVGMYSDHFLPMIDLCTGEVRGIPPTVEQYFASPDVVRRMRGMSAQVRAHVSVRLIRA